MSNELSRRDLLKGSAAAVAGLAFAAGASASSKTPLMEEALQGAANRKLRFGIIGCGGKGWSGMQEAAQFGDIVALCDVDINNRTKAMMEYPRASAFNDYRSMLDFLHREIDAVVISIPDHGHAAAAAMAMRHGLHTYCEKPLTRTIWEARQLARIAREKKVATQMGNQSTSYSPLRKTAALIKSGAFGAVKEIHLWTNRSGNWWPQGMARPEAKLTPKTVDFRLWLGPSPDRPYADGYHPFAWRGYWDFGTGALGDIGCHNMNLTFMALDLRDPIAVKAETSGHNRDSYPLWSIVHYEFGVRNGRAPVGLHWYDGGKLPAAELGPGVTFGGNGSLVVCEKATIYSPNEYGGDPVLIGGGTMPDIEFEVSPGHMAEFAAAALGGKPARSNFPDYSSGLTETVLLGNLAVWAGGDRLEWDARNMKVKGTDEYDGLIKPTYQPGWTL